MALMEANLKRKNKMTQVEVVDMKPKKDVNKGRLANIIDRVVDAGSRFEGKFTDKLPSKLTKVKEDGDSN